MAKASDAAFLINYAARHVLLKLFVTGNSMEKLITLEQRKTISRISEEVLAASEEIFLQSVKKRRTLIKKGIKLDEAVLNVYEFVPLLQFELSCLMSDMVKNGSPLRQNLYARYLILTIHEACKALKSLLAQRFRVELTQRLGLQDDRKLKNIHSKICELFELCNKHFEGVRNGIAAHRDRDPETRIKLLEQADIKVVTDLVITMLQVMGELQKILLSYTPYIFGKNLDSTQSVKI